MAKKMANLGMEYYTLDNATTLDAARQDPAGFVRCMDRAIVDEIQRAPELLLAIKESVDTVDIVIEDRRGRVVGIEIKAAAAAADGGACFRLKYDGRKLPFLQTLRNAHEGINVFCIEPATHDRLPRKELREMEALASTPRGGSHMFHLEMLFDSGK
ncbi:hypothetical protein LCM4573_11055 [Rhizobium sp. LCM 4573]|nr:hypothetical protein LCM4573_11055 [Rhizobium sp. LCM 4573]